MPSLDPNREAKKTLRRMIASLRAFSDELDVYEGVKRPRSRPKLTVVQEPCPKEVDNDA